MKDYYAILRIQQGRLRAAMQDAGVKNAAELSRRTGIDQASIGRLLNFRGSPRCKTGEWKPTTLRICKALEVQPDELFPEHLDHEIPTNCIEAFVEHAQLCGQSQLQLNPAEECELTDMAETLNTVLDTLSERERRVLKARFMEGKTLDGIAEEFGVSREAIRQNERRALHHVRHPERLRKLEGLVPGCG